MLIPVPDFSLRRQKGVGLIEVLVAIVILSIGALGFAAMQLKAMRMSGDSYARGQATAIAQDLIERMTMNKSTMITAASGYAATLSASDYVTPQSSLVTNCQTGSCTDAQMVVYDINQVSYYANTLLPQGLISGRLAATGSRNVQVFVSWGGTLPTVGNDLDDCMQQGSGSQLVYSANANCVMVEATFP